MNIAPPRMNTAQTLRTTSEVDMRPRNLILTLASSLAVVAAVAGTQAQAATPGPFLNLMAAGQQLSVKAPVQAVLVADECSLFATGAIKKDNGPKDLLALSTSLSECTLEHLLGGDLKSIEISDPPLQASLKFAHHLVEVIPGPCTYSFGNLTGKIVKESPLTIEAEAVGKLMRKQSSIFCAGAYVGHFTSYVNTLSEEPVDLQIVLAKIE
ncbi:MAG TPA: hypothetical protein VMD79_00855 [Solirubrobacteraceae bacterium]|nr:hypothetical protein [Solirubrobacteraceae bacterium]